MRPHSDMLHVRVSAEQIKSCLHFLFTFTIFLLHSSVHLVSLYFGWPFQRRHIHRKGQYLFESTFLVHKICIFFLILSQFFCFMFIPNTERLLLAHTTTNIFSVKAMRIENEPCLQSVRFNNL